MESSDKSDEISHRSAEGKNADNINHKQIKIALTLEMNLGNFQSRAYEDRSVFLLSFPVSLII